MKLVYTICPFFFLLYTLSAAGLDYVPGISNLAVFQPPGNSVVCTSFEIIDDLLALEEDEKFIIDTAPEEGEFEIGDNNQTVVTIKDNDGMACNSDY